MHSDVYQVVYCVRESVVNRQSAIGMATPNERKSPCCFVTHPPAAPVPDGAIRKVLDGVRGANAGCCTCDRCTSTCKAHNAL